jgi:hypothetical protein
VLLSEETHPIDHLLGAGAGRLEARVETGVLALQELDALRRNNPLHSGGLQALETRFCLKRAASKRSELVAKMLYEQLELTKRRYFRPYAV